MFFAIGVFRYVFVRRMKSFSVQRPPPLLLNSNIRDDNHKFTQFHKFKIQNKNTTPTMSQTEDYEKRVEKLLKKTKPFFDEKSKPKTRLFALSAFLEAAQGDSAIQQRFFAENCTTVFGVLWDAFWHQTDKIRALKDKTKDGREMMDFFKIVGVFRSLLIYCKWQISQGWERDKMGQMFRVLLHHGNYIRLRVEGLRLLLVWFNNQDSKVFSQGDADVMGMIQLYRDAVWLASFAPSWQYPLPSDLARQDGTGSVIPEAGGQIEQGKTGANDVNGPLMPSMEAWNLTANAAVSNWKLHQSREDGVILFEEILYNFVVLARAHAIKDVPSVPPLPSPKSTPSNASTLNNMWGLFIKYYLRILFPGLALKLQWSTDVKVGFPSCPPDLLRSLLTFVSNASKYGDAVVKNDEVLPGTKGAVEVLQRLLLVENGNVVHEMVRQSLLLPWRFSETIGLGLNILREWMFCVPEERPLHMQATLFNSVVQYDENVCKYVRRYIRMIRFMFLERLEMTDWPMQHDLMDRALQMYRTLATESWIVLDVETWECLMMNLLDVFKQLFYGDSTSFGTVGVADEFVGMFSETIFVVWIRSGTEKKELWECLCRCFSDSRTTRWLRVIHEWSSVMLVLTRNLGIYGFNVDVDGLSKDVLESSGVITRKRGVRGQTPSISPSEFTGVLKLPFTPKNAAFLWKNMACILGNINHHSPASQAEAMTCVVNVVDMLLEIRAGQPYDSTVHPPIYDLAPWLFQACELGNEYLAGKQLALGGVCRLMCRRHDQPVPDVYFYHFYRLYMAAMIDSPSIVMSQATRLFNLDLPGSQVLISSTIKGISTVFSGEATEQTRINAAMMLNSLIGWSHLLSTSNLKGEMRALYLSSLRDSLSLNKLEERVKSHVCLLNGFACFLSEDYVRGYCVDSDVDFFMVHLTVMNARVLSACLDGLQVFGGDGGGLVERVVTGIVDAVQHHFSERSLMGGGELVRASLISSLFGALEEWVLHCPPSFSGPIFSKVFDVVQVGMKSRNDEGDVIICDAAEGCLLRILHFGSTHSDVRDDPVYDEGDGLFFSFNDGTILCLVEREEGTRVICRDVVGKYAWDFSSRISPSSTVSQPCTRVPSNVTLVECKGEPVGERKADELELLMVETLSLNPDLPQVPGMTVPTPFLGTNFPATCTLPIQNNSGKMAHFTPTPKRPGVSSLLTNLGFVNFDALSNQDFFHLLLPSPSFFRDVRGLDKRAGRETYKVGLLYVGFGQEDEEILRNDVGSLEYEEFCRGLGVEVDLENHQGYTGGLESHHGIYYANYTTEVMFHEVTRLVPGEKLGRKRHIGNDSVHVVWNEHVRNYKSGTISGDFANVQIIVTPMSNSLYACDVFRDIKYNPGPVEGYTTLTSLSLSGLIRASVISANRQMTNDLKVRGAFGQRRLEMDVITHRHRVKNWTMEVFLQSLNGVN
jgi:hypothetical protein